MSPEPSNTEEACGVSHRPCERSGESASAPLKDLSRADRFSLAKRGPTLVFDGVCNLCNASMSWYFERLVAEDAVFFMWAQHEDTQDFLADVGIGSDIYKSWAYIRDSVVYRGSSAWFQAMEHLCVPWRWLSSLNTVPHILREGAYGVVSSNRYSLLGKTSQCQSPPSRMIECFLHDTTSTVHGGEDITSAEANGGEVTGEPTTSKDSPVGRRLLVVGCGPAGIQIVRNLASEFSVILVEPKDYYEFTPGILRGLCDPDHLKTLQVTFAEAFRDLPVEHMRGQVVGLRERSASVWMGNVTDGIAAATGGADTAPSDKGGAVVEVPFDFAVVAVGSQYAGSSLWKITGAPGEESETCLAGRQTGLETTRQRLLSLRERGGAAILVGAGLVGVELAAELAHYIPGLRIVLADLQTKVLPALPESAQTYAQDWLISHGVELRLGTALPRGGSDADIAAALEIKTEVMVLGCAGVSMRSSFMASLNCLTAKGEIRVNRALQVLSGSPSPEDVKLLGPERAAVCGNGRIFALGDCVAIEGLDAPLTKDIYPAEAMVDVIVANLRLSPRVQCLRTCPGVLYEMRKSLQQMTLCSLGPNDCIFVMNGYKLATGFVATNMKHQIEITKMGQMRNQLWGSLIWKLVPHF